MEELVIRGNPLVVNLCKPKFDMIFMRRVNEKKKEEQKNEEGANDMLKILQMVMKNNVNQIRQPGQPGD